MNTEAGPGAARRALPAVDQLLRLTDAAELVDRHGRPSVVAALRERLAWHRERLGTLPAHAVPDAHELLREGAVVLQASHGASLRAVHNLTGTVIHTNLGRALLPQAAVEAAVQAMTRPVNLEYDLDGGARGERDEHVERWLTQLTGAQAAVVVNNNAAAVYLVLGALAVGREVVVSRGELVEIGGSFRIPDIMASAGCTLREVGTTNRTHLRDYAGAIGERTAALMKVHTSNYAIQGFTSAVAEAELARLGQAHQLPLFVDLGSGTLLDLRRFGLPHEPTAQEAIAAGAAIVTFSGDKLLGGPQCGMIVGTRELIERIRRHPMKRAMRLDKLRLAALEAVLRLYTDPDRLAERLPTLRLLTRTRPDIQAQARRVQAPVQQALDAWAEVRVIECTSQIGSGALPVESLPSAGLAMQPKPGAPGADHLAAAWRALPQPVIGRIQSDAFLLDLRCLDDEAGFLAQLGQLPGP